MALVCRLENMRSRDKMKFHTDEPNMCASMYFVYTYEMIIKTRSGNRNRNGTRAQIQHRVHTVVPIPLNIEREHGTNRNMHGNIHDKWKNHRAK